MTPATGRTARWAVHGTCTALVTPFRDGAVDEPALRALVGRQLAAGVDWLVPLGTTGETPTLTADERQRVLERVLEWSAGRSGVLVGTGTNATASTIERTRRAAEAGADAALVVTPYYNRPPAEGLYRHFAAVADAVDLPLVLYDVPARTGRALPLEVVVRLRTQYPHVVALKHATGAVAGVTELRQACDIVVLSGDDALTWPLLALGAQGVVSVVSNLWPELMKSLVDLGRAGRVDEARAVHERVQALADALGRFGPNPVPIKTALALAGLMAEEFRLPLCPLSAANRVQLADALRQAGGTPLPGATQGET